MDRQGDHQLNHLNRPGCLKPLTHSLKPAAFRPRQRLDPTSTCQSPPNFPSLLLKQATFGRNQPANQLTHPQAAKSPFCSAQPTPLQAGLVPTLAWLEGGERRVLQESLIINE